MLLIAWETVEWCSLASSALVFIKKVRSVHTCGLRGVWATALHNVRPFGIHFSAQEHLHTHTPHTCIMYIANVLKNCVKKLTYEKCLREIWKFGHKADLRRSSRLKLVVNATSKRPRNEHQVEDDDDDADDNEPEEEEEHWGWRVALWLSVVLSAL